MQQGKRKFLIQAGGLAASGMGLSRLAQAQGTGSPAERYPARPITMIIPSTPGGAGDNMGRLIAEPMSKELGQPIIMDYKAGGGGMIAAGALAKLPADGYTVLFTTTAPVFYAPHMSTKLTYDARRDFTLISQVTDGGLVMLVNKDVPATDMKQLVAWVRQQGKGKATYGSYGTGTVSHLLTSYLSESRDLGMTHVAYRGEAQFVQDMLAGHLPMGIGSIWTATPHIASGKLRALAVFTPKRHATLPDVPTMLEQGFDDAEFKLVSGMFLVGPAHLPPAVVARLEAAIRKTMAMPAIRERFLSLGTTPVVGSADEAKALFDSSYARLARLVKISGATLD